MDEKRFFCKTPFYLEILGLQSLFHAFGFSQFDRSVNDIYDICICGTFCVINNEFVVMIAGLTAILEIKEIERAVFVLTIINISFFKG
jgi:hypothetical protein